MGHNYISQRVQPNKEEAIPTHTHTHTYAHIHTRTYMRRASSTHKHKEQSALGDKYQSLFLPSFTLL